MSAIKQDVNAPLILTVGVVSALLLLVVAFGLEAWFVWEEHTWTERKWHGFQNMDLVDLRKAQEAKITNAGFADEQKTQPTIALRDARQLIIQNGGKLPATQPATTKPK
jgi:hypothetical protein